MRNRNALIIISKYPEKGAVKTRINGLSDEQRVALYDRLLNTTMSKLSFIPGVDTFMAFAPSDAEEYFSRFSVDLIPLDKDDLGRSMYQAFCFVFQQGYEKVSLAGADIPDLSVSIINDSFNKLSENDLVFGPAKDGGYYLVGMKEPVGEVFRNIPWSSSKTLEASIKNAEQAGYTVGLITTLSDIDTIEDAKELGLI
jgi:rSAM/selenodomain-associated transferase 1